MRTYHLKKNEIIIFNEEYTHGMFNTIINLTLTNKNIIIEQKEGFITKTWELEEVIPLQQLEGCKRIGSNVLLTKRNDDYLIKTDSKYSAKDLVQTIKDVKKNPNDYSKINNPKEDLKEIAKFVKENVTVTDAVKGIYKGKKEIKKFLKLFK